MPWSGAQNTVAKPGSYGGVISMDDGCLKFYSTGLDANQRRRIAHLISQFFHSQDLPGHKHMDIELANHIADALPGLVCGEVGGDSPG